MNTVTAVRNRILQLCEEQGITINGLATISGLPPSSIKNILVWEKFESQNRDHQNDLRWVKYHLEGIF